MLAPLCRYVGYVRAGRTIVQPLDELLQLPPFALGFDFHTPIKQVPYSSIQAESCCLQKDEPPVEHALHGTRDDGVQQSSVRLVCHE